MQLSVVAPVLNEEFFLPLYLENVLAYAGEVILLDGGSTDQTLEIARAYQQKDKRVKIIEFPQEGLPYSDDWNEGYRRNLLLELAQGDWILALDADEIMSDNFASILPELLNDQAVDIYGFQMYSFWGDPFTLRLNVPGDSHWQGITYRLLRNNGQIRHAQNRHHSPFLYQGMPLWSQKEGLAVRSEIGVFHYHYGLGPRLKFNDNRRGDANRFNNMGEPDWSYQPKNYALKTEPFQSRHPQVIERFLASSAIPFTDCKRIPEIDLTYLSFDRYQRFQALAELANSVAHEGLQILDIGLEDGDFSLFMPRHQVTWLDKSDALGVTSLPFSDQSFDLALAVDVLGVMAPETWKGFLRELVRVARQKVVLATPHAGALAVERIIYDLTNNRYLQPHLEKGLPSEEELDALISEMGLPYRKLANTGLAAWLGMLLVNHFIDGDNWRSLNHFFNRNFARQENRAPCYRLIYELQILGGVNFIYQE